MCTTGVLRLGEDDYVLFKNKDFGRSRFEDRLVVERGVFGVEGISTWAGSAADLDVFSGFSIGANDSGVLCCDSNVRTMDDHANYDDLVELALREGADVASGVGAVQRAVEQQPYLWGNLILIDSSDQAVIEVRGTDVEVRSMNGPTACTNHHSVFEAHPDIDDTGTTERRLASAQQYLAMVTSIEDIFALERTHDDGATGICNHSARQTVYSYVLQRRGETTTLHVSQGKPCEEPARVVLELPLGSAWSLTAATAFRSGYPSARATTDALV
ncbi:MAG: hypothetical protein U9N84_00970 [Actinomycetota bacterium]|nr:hypothetical protein [Actinomycetota bacterium]